MKFTSYFLALVVAVVVFSCKESGNKKDEASVSSSNAALVQLNALNDSCSKAWTLMMDSDDQKIKDIQRLLQEISYIPGHNESDVERLSKKTKDLQAGRYTQQTISSEKIDAYDSATDALLKEVFELKRNTKGVENYTLTEELEKSIREADGMVVNYRVLYDRWAQKFNESFETTIKSSDLQGEELEKLKKKATFAI